MIFLRVKSLQAFLNQTVARTRSPVLRFNVSNCRFLRLLALFLLLVLLSEGPKCAICCRTWGSAYSPERAQK